MFTAATIVPVRDKLNGTFLRNDWLVVNDRSQGTFREKLTVVWINCNIIILVQIHQEMPNYINKIIPQCPVITVNR